VKSIVSSFFCFALLAAHAQVRLAHSDSLAALSHGDQPGITTPAVSGASDLHVTISQSIILDHREGIRRISIANPDIAEAVAVSSTELLINGKSMGDTTLILWDTLGRTLTFNVHVSANSAKLDAVRDELLREVGKNVSLSIEDGNVFLRGTANDQIEADRAAGIAATLGKVVNLLRVLVPAGQPQILLKVRFANVSRSASVQLGLNLFSGNSKGVAGSTTGQFGQQPAVSQFGGTSPTETITDLLNIFYFRPDLDIGAVLQALEAKSLAQTLAEPNLLTQSGQPASFLAGGEFPFPTIQGGGSGVGQITIQFKEFGIKLNFLPVVTPRGTIQLTVTPEVSSLDYTNGLTVSGYTVPGLATRRVQTEVELKNGQSFVIAGLLDNELSQTLDKMPGIGNIPVLGKLFQSKTVSKSKDELLVLVTPEIVRPIPGDVKPPELKMPIPFVSEGGHSAPQTPGAAITGPVPPLPATESLPVEQLKSMQATAAPANSNSNQQAPLMVVRPVETTPNTQSTPPVPNP
jgi:pilus assembly protein CpaC